MMKKSYLNVQKEFCSECSLALMPFMGNMKGVESVTADDGKVALTFDDSLISEEAVLKIAERISRRWVTGLMKGIRGTAGSLIPPTLNILRKAVS